MAKFKGRTVKLNKPFRTPSASKKFGVYVRNNKTKDDKYKILWYKKIKELANGRTSTLSSSITSKVRWDNVKRGARIYKTNDST